MYDSVATVDHIWSYGDMYWKLAEIHYKDSKYWWLIASFNKRPTEAHNKIGDTIKIPVNLSEALQVAQ